MLFVVQMRFKFGSGRLRVNCVWNLWQKFESIRICDMTLALELKY